MPKLKGAKLVFPVNLKSLGSFSGKSYYGSRVSLALHLLYMLGSCFATKLGCSRLVRKLYFGAVFNILMFRERLCQL